MKQSKPESQFIQMWIWVNPQIYLANEYRFAPPRRWRFDFAHVESKVAIEIEGGTWTQGRHTRGEGFAKDCEKYNAAVYLGWGVVRLTPEMIQPDELEKIAKCILKRSK